MADNPLWRFSLDFYGRAGVEGDCLALQDRFGLDVNIVLLCCWLGVCGRRLDVAAIAAIEADRAFRDWREEVIRPLRAVRRGLKSMSVEGAPALRRDVAEAELAAEAVAQRMLYALCGDGGGRGGSADAVYTNLAAYLEAAGVGSADRLCRRLAAAAMVEDDGGPARGSPR